MLSRETYFQFMEVFDPRVASDNLNLAWSHIRLSVWDRFGDVTFSKVEYLFQLPIGNQ